MMMKRCYLFFIFLFLCIVASSCNKNETVEKAEKVEASKDQTALFSIIQDDKMGFINKKGEVVIKPQFDNVTSPITSLAFQYIWDWWNSFFERLAYVGIDGKWGYINKEGKYVWGPE